MILLTLFVSENLLLIVKSFVFENSCDLVNFIDDVNLAVLLVEMNNQQVIHHFHFQLSMNQL